MKSDNIDNVGIAFDRYFNPSNFKTSLINLIGLNLGG
jgi:hypothetical protein